MYVQIGKLVFFATGIVLSANSTSGAYDELIGGLPKAKYATYVLLQNPTTVRRMMVNGTGAGSIYEQIPAGRYSIIGCYVCE